MATSEQHGQKRPQLEDNVVFPEAFDSDAAWDLATSIPQASLSAYDNAGRLYIWNPEGCVVHYVNVDRDVVSGSLSTLRSAGQEASFDTLDPTPSLDFPPVSITISRNGRYVALVGEAALAVLDAQSTQDTDSPDVATCIVHRVAASLFSGTEGSRSLLQVAWHPGSDTHLGCLSSDGVFRLFDLSRDKDSPEQEYYLQRPHGASAGFTQPTDFVFGGEHLWEKFTVFFLWSDGAIFPLCPVVPFGSLYSLASISALVRDMEQSAPQDSPADADPTLAWLQEVFPLTDSHATSPPRAHSKAVRAAAGMVVGAHAHVPYDCSPALQGPLPFLGPGTPPLRKGVTAGSLVSSTSGKDSLLGWTLSDGSLHVAVLTDEVLPTWNHDHIPQTMLDTDGQLLSVTMVAEAADVARPDWPRVPHLLPLASVDLALSPSVLSRAPLTLLADPLVPERILCRHGRGVDAVTLRWLPFSDAAAGTRNLADIPPPDVSSLLDAREGDGADVQPLMGLAVVSDSGGETWVVASPVGGGCVVASVRSHAPTALPSLLVPVADAEGGEAPALSPNLAQQPKKYRIPQAPPGPSLTTASHEGRLFLHHQCKGLRDRYIEYAHRVHVELTARAARLEEIVREQRKQLEGAQKTLAKAETKADAFEGRLAGAHARHAELERRLQRYSRLPSVSRTPLTAVERTYRTEIVGMDADLPLLRSTLSALIERADELLHGRGNGAAAGCRAPPVPHAQMARLKQAVERSTGVVSGMVDKVHLLEESIHRKERHAVR